MSLSSKYSAVGSSALLTCSTAPNVFTKWKHWGDYNTQHQHLYLQFNVIIIMWITQYITNYIFISLRIHIGMKL